MTDAHGDDEFANELRELWVVFVREATDDGRRHDLDDVLPDLDRWPETNG